MQWVLHLATSTMKSARQMGAMTANFLAFTPAGFSRSPSPKSKLRRAPVSRATSSIPQAR